MRVVRQAVTGLMLCLGLLAAEAHACSCHFAESTQEALARADAVFRGRIVSRTAVPDDAHPYAYRYEFEVLEWFKGPGGRTFLVGTGGGGGDCGWDVWWEGYRESEAALVVFAHAVNTEQFHYHSGAPYEAMTCSDAPGNRDETLADLRRLTLGGALAQPPGRGACGACSTSDGSGLLVALCALRLLRGRRVRKVRGGVP